MIGGPRRTEPLFSRLSGSLLTLLYLRQAPARVCHDCQVDYVPELTDDRCPICGTLAGEPRLAVRRARRRDLAGASLCWLVGIIVFLLLVHALYG